MMRLVDCEYKWGESATRLNSISKNIEAIFDESKADGIVIMIIWLISLFTRCYMIKNPSFVCFDETFFGNFTNYYIHKKYFIDIHPPLGKLILFWGSRIVGYDGSIEFGVTGNGLTNSIYISLRLIPAVFASLCPPLLYAFSRTFGFSITASITSSLSMCMEALMIIEGKFLLTDSILHFFVCLSMYSMSLFFRESTNQRKGWMQFGFICLSISLASSTKQTAWGLIPIAMYVIIMSSLINLDDHMLTSFLFGIIIKIIILLLSVCIVYFGAFVVHIHHLTEISDESVHICPGISKNQKNRTEEWEKCKSQNIISKIYSLMKHMHYCNMNSISYKSFSTKWWEWPFMRGELITYFFKGENRTYLVHNICNTLSGFLSMFSFLLSLVFSLYKKSPKSYRNSIVSSILAFGFLVSWLPFYFIPRSTYLYHYCIPLVFVIAFNSYLIDTLNEYSKALSIIVSLAILSSSIAFYIVYMPWIYAKPSNNHEMLMKLINKKL